MAVTASIIMLHVAADHGVARVAAVLVRHVQDVGAAHGS